MTSKDSMKYFKNKSYYHIKKQIIGNQTKFSTSSNKPTNDSLENYEFSNYTANGDPVFVRYYE